MESNLSIQNLIWGVINDIQSHKDSYDPVTLSEQIITLSTLYANLTKQIADFENQYHGVIGLALDKDPDKPYNKIEKEAKRGEEYYKLRKAEALEKSVIQIIRSANKYIRLKEQEQQISKFQ
jgi:hypothetical protein